jgi:hypothetical protein
VLWSSSSASVESTLYIAVLISFLSCGMCGAPVRG